jgi:hypothetical protein
MYDIHHIPVREYGDDPARVGTPDYLEWAEGEREQLISDRADEIYQEVNELLGSASGRTITIRRQEYDEDRIAAEIFESFSTQELKPLLYPNSFTPMDLIEKWSEQMATQEVDNGEYPDGM